MATDTQRMACIAALAAEAKKLGSMAEAYFNHYPQAAGEIVDKLIAAYEANAPEQPGS